MPVPSHQKKSWVKSGARFCASSAITVTCWAVWLVLGCTLACLVYVALARELPVPGFVLRRIESELAASGLDLKFGRARIDPLGKVLLEDVQVRTRQFDDPLLACRLLYIRHDFWSLLSDRPAPAEIQLEGASLYLPAMLSTSGTTEAVVRDLAARLHYEQHVWEIEQLAAQVGPVRVTAHGEVIPTTRSGAASQFSLTDLTARYLENARRLQPVLHQLEAFDAPSLTVRFNRTRADLQLTVSGAHHPWGQPLVTGPLIITTGLRIDLPGRQPLRAVVTARHVDYNEGQVVVERVRATLAGMVTAGSFTAEAVELRVAAGLVSAVNEQLVAPVVRAKLSAWPAVHVEAMTQLDGEFLAAAADVQLQEKSALIRAEGRVSADLISRTLSVETPRAAPYFVFGDPVWFKAEATFAPGWKFEGVSSRVDAGRIDSHGVKLTAARGRIDIRGMSFLAYDAYAEIGESHARGSYWMDFSTTDYRMLLDGQLQPVDISGWFKGDWWPAFWNRYFSFPGTLPVATVDVGGRWRDSSLSNNFIVARGGPATVWGGDFEHIDATVFVRPGFAHAWNIDATRAGGSQRVTGWFKRTATPGIRDESRFEFNFTGNPDLAVVNRLLEGRADDIIAPLVVTAPPQLHAEGAFDGSETAYQFTGETRTPLHYFGVPLDNARVVGAVQHGTDIELDAIEFEAVGGSGKVRASVRGEPNQRRLGFDIFVNGAKLGRVVHAYEAFDAWHSGRPYVASPDGKFVQKAANSTLDFAFSAQGIMGNVASFKGTGNAALTGAELGEVRLFGLLSQVLSGLSLNFSSLKLDAIRTSFTVDNGTAHFPDLKVTGPSAVIDARGNYGFASNVLDFNAKLKPYDQPGSLLAAAFSLVMNPLTSLLELRLTGPFGDPKWSVDVTAPSSKPTRPPEPKAPAAAATPPATK